MDTIGIIDELAYFGVFISSLNLVEIVHGSPAAIAFHEHIESISIHFLELAQLFGFPIRLISVLLLL